MVCGFIDANGTDNYIVDQGRGLKVSPKSSPQSRGQEYNMGCQMFQGTYQYSTVQYSTVQYSTVQYSTVQYSTVQYSTVQYSTVQYSTVQYSTVQYKLQVLYRIFCRSL